MNLFKKIYTEITDKVKEFNRERQLKASSKTYVAKLEEELLRFEKELAEAVKNDSYDYKDIVEKYESIAFTKDSIKLARETYEYLFKEKVEEKAAA